MAMKCCPDCGWSYPDTYRECPFCKEENDAKQKKRSKVRTGKRAVRFSKRFRLIAGTQILFILVMIGSLNYLLRDISHKDDASEDNAAPVISVNDPSSKGSEVSAEPLQPETSASDDKELLSHADEHQSGVPGKEDGGTSTAPTGGDVPVGDSGIIPELRTGNAVVINAENGVRVRSGPSTSSQALASVYNGAPVQVIRRANDNWYEITFLNAGGMATTGYMMGDFLKNV